MAKKETVWGSQQQAGRKATRECHSVSPMLMGCTHTHFFSLFCQKSLLCYSTFILFRSVVPPMEQKGFCCCCRYSSPDKAIRRRISICLKAGRQSQEDACLPVSICSLTDCLHPHWEMSLCGWRQLLLLLLMLFSSTHPQLSNHKGPITKWVNLTATVELNMQMSEWVSARLVIETKTQRKHSNFHRRPGKLVHLCGGGHKTKTTKVLLRPEKRKTKKDEWKHFRFGPSVLARVRQAWRLCTRVQLGTNPRAGSSGEWNCV